MNCSSATIAALVIAALLPSQPASAFEYVVEGVQPVQVSVDDELVLTGSLVAGIFYVMPLVISGIGAGLAKDGDQANALTGLALAAPPIVGGVLLGQHHLDQMVARDDREGGAVLVTMLMWGASAAQVIGLGVVGFAFVTADRQTPLE